MSKERIVLDSDLRYIDKGNLLRSRSELSVAKMLSFLGQNYEYDVSVVMPDGESVKIDFKAIEGGGRRSSGSSKDKYIEVVDSEEDAIKFKDIRKALPSLDIIAVGHSKYASRVSEIDSFFFFDSGNHMQSGSIFFPYRFIH
jgi:6-pyruvoyltetrahydropterin/6-carboxytetrahydropterin synthase